MGNCYSNQSRKSTTVSKSGRRSNFDRPIRDENDGGEMSQSKYDELEIKKLRRELEETPHIFVLNNLLMSMMFFQNFESDRLRLMQSSLTTLEKELNPSLLAEETIECCIPDVIFEKVNKNVRFVRRHGPKKNQIEPIVPRRMYVINDNIEVVESKNVPQYSAIDKPNYQVIVEKEDRHLGFVKLKSCPNQSRQIHKPDNLQAAIPKEPVAGPSSRSDQTEDIYDYTTIANLNTPKPLSIVQCERRDTLPTTCFTVRKIKKYADKKGDSDSDSDMEEEPSVKKQEDLFERVTYISSNGFMNHFQNAVFPNSVGKSIGFDSGAISAAKAIPGKIFCNLQDVDENLENLPCEVIPSIAIPWPVDLTFEFHDRSARPTMWDNFGGEYRWPRSNMISEIRSLSCVLVPRGYIPKRGDNPDLEIEWEVNFPKAQRYLDTHMSHVQVRAFLFLLTLYKSHIEPVNGKYDGLLVDHIRTHMYWECESNPRDWPEHRLGTKMVKVIQNFIKKLSQNNLPDFFISQKNMFLNVPNKHLTHAQKVFHSVLESPAIYFIGALRNLKYSNPKFYPMLDFKELYVILTSATGQLLNPRILEFRPPNKHPKHRRADKVDGDVNYRKEIIWRKKQEGLNRQKVLQKQKEKDIKEENLRIQNRGSIDSIDYTWEGENKFDVFKCRAVLSFFILHFIEMAKWSPNRQALFYLKQATYLARLLEEIGLQVDARDFIEVITREEIRTKKDSISDSYDPPQTPKRVSSQFSWEINQQVKNNNINLNNLHKSYSSLGVSTNQIKLRKIPSNLKRPRASTDNVRRSAVGFSDSVTFNR